MEYINITKKLHEAFPEFDVETIIKILEVIKSEELPSWIISNNKQWNTTIDKNYNQQNTITDKSLTFYKWQTT